MITAQDVNDRQALVSIGAWLNKTSQTYYQSCKMSQELYEDLLAIVGKHGGDKRNYGEQEYVSALCAQCNTMKDAEFEAFAGDLIPGYYLFVVLRRRRGEA